MKLVPLTRGLFAKVDDADYAAVSAFKWHALKSRNSFYAARTVYLDGKRRRAYLYLHRFLLPEASRVDHRDGNGLNCRRENLRPATVKQNAHALCGKRPGASSRFRGVSWNADCQKWESQIRAAGKKLHLGLFVDEEAAARAYDTAANRHFGEFSAPNFPTLC